MQILAPTVTMATTAGDIWVPESYRQSGEPTGFDPDYPTTLSFAYGATTSTVTITPTGAEMHLWLGGVRHVLSGAQTVSFSTADGIWYISYVEGVGWRASQTVWTIDPITAPACIVYVNKTDKAAGLLADERHGIAMDWATHQRLHHVDGAQVSGGGAISGYVVYATAGSNPSVGNNTYALASTTLRDEDIALTVPAVADDGPYCVARKTGASTLWTWDATAVAPFFCSNYTPGASYIQYNQYTGGAWTLTPLTNGQFCNYYVFATDFVNPSVAGYLIVPGQAVYATLAAAQAESVLGLDLSGFMSAEFAPVWQVTYVASSNANFNDMVGRCSIAATPVRLVGYKTSVASAIAPSSHAALSNRDLPDSHPAAAITATPYGNLSGTTVEAQLKELDDEKAAASALGNYVPVDYGAYAATTTDVLRSGVNGEAAYRFYLNADGKMEWGGGAGAVDISLERSGANVLSVSQNLVVNGYLAVGGNRAQSGDLRMTRTGTIAWRNQALNADITILSTDSNDDTFLNADTGNAVKLSVASTPVLSVAAGNAALTGTLDLTVPATTTDAITVKVTGDAVTRLVVNGDGSLQWGDGAGAQDISLARWLAGVGLFTGTLYASTGLGVTGGAVVITQAAGNGALQITESGDAGPSFWIFPTGQMLWSDGTNPADTNLYRFGASVLGTDDALVLNGADSYLYAKPDTSGRTILFVKVGVEADYRLTVDATGKLVWGDGTNAGDVNLYRNGANILKTDDTFVAYGLTATSANIIADLSSTGGFQINNATVAKWYIQNRTDDSDSFRITSGAAKIAVRAVQATGAVQFDHYVGIGGSAPTDDRLLNVGGTVEGTQAYTYGLICAPTAPATSTSGGTAVYAQYRTAAAAFTMGAGIALRVVSPSVGATSAITGGYGLYIDQQGVSGVGTGFGIWQDHNGDQNYFAGRIGIGGVAATSRRLNISGTHPGTDTGLTGLGVDFTVPSTATATSAAIYTRPPTSAAAAFSMNYSIGLWIAGAAAPGAGSTINQRYGIYTDAITGATNNYSMRIAASAQGTMWLSADADNTTSAAGIMFGSSKDTNLYRSAADYLCTDDTMQVLGSYVALGAGTRVLGSASTAAGTVKFSSNVSGDVANRFYFTASGGLTWGDGTNAPDTSLYRGAAGQLYTTALYMIGPSSAGTTPYADMMFRLGGTAGSGTTTYGLVSQVTAPATSTTQFFGVYTQVVTAASAFTMGAGYGLYVAAPNKGAGSAVTTIYGMLIAAQTGGATASYGAAIYAATTATLWLSAGSDSTTPAGGIHFGSSLDTNLYRSAANTLQTDDSLVVAGDKIELQSGYLLIDNTIYNTTIATKVTADADDRFKATSEGVLYWGDGTNTVDVNLYRHGANILKTDDDFEALSLTGTLDASNIAWPASSGWSVTNKTVDKTLDCNATTLAELADNVGTLIDVLIAAGIITA